MLNESDHGNRKLPCSPTVIPSTEVLNQGALVRLPVAFRLVHKSMHSHLAKDDKGLDKASVHDKDELSV